MRASLKAAKKHFVAVPVLGRTANTTVWGKACGVAFVADTRFLACSDMPVHAQDRLVDVLIWPRSDVTLDLVNVYGFTPQEGHLNLTEALLEIAVARQNARGLKYRAILRDFNNDLSNSAVWAALQLRGWVDAAAHSASIFGQEPQLTCKGRLARIAF